MKKYTFTIEVEDFKSNGSFIENLNDEINDEARQLELTHKINKQTMLEHRKILVDFIGPINDELDKAGLGFDDFRYMDNSNEYKSSMCKLSFYNISKSFVIGIFGENERGFEHSKYTTYTGKYVIKIGENDSSGYSAQQSNILTTTVKDTNNVFDKIRYQLKEELLRAKKNN